MPRHKADPDDLKFKLGNRIVAAANWVELAIAAVVFLALLAGCVPTVFEMIDLWRNGAGSEGFHNFLGTALNLVIGIEFIEMLTKHSPGNALEVLLFAIVRHMLVGHAEGLDSLLSVIAIAVIFCIRKFAFSSSFGEEDGPAPAPEAEHPEEAVP